MAKTQRCARCGRRYRGQDDWNADYIAGIEVALYCPSDQTPDEDLAAQIDLILDDVCELDISGEEGPARLCNSLVITYPTPEVMRRKADRLASARRDPHSCRMVKLMRSLADDMELGDRWWENGR